MKQFAPLIQAIRNTDDLTDKCRLLECLLNMCERERTDRADAQLAETFVFEQLPTVYEQMKNADGYKSLDALLDYEDKLFGLLITVTKKPINAFSDERIQLIRSVTDFAEGKRVLEKAVDGAFERDRVGVDDVRAFLDIAAKSGDEYQKGKVYQGLLYYRDRKALNKLTDGAKDEIAQYLCGEMERYLKADTLDGDEKNNLELACDVCGDFFNDKLAGHLTQAAKTQDNVIRYYALSSLLAGGQPADASVVATVAGDVVYADLLYDLLKKYGQENLFPAELANREYLAKSDLVHWLIYPTELGKAPDKIEYLGQVNVKGDEPYYVFKYMSDSDNLDGALKNQWLIGWSSEDGGTFSNFDRLADYEKKTPEKTLKNIKKKLIG